MWSKGGESLECYMGATIIVFWSFGGWVGGPRLTLTIPWYSFLDEKREKRKVVEVAA